MEDPVQTGRFRGAWRLVPAAILVLGSAGTALAHATEGGLVLLLPTDVYTAAGAAAVALTVLLMAVLPERVLSVLFAPGALLRLPRTRAPQITSTLAAVVFLGLSGWQVLRLRLPRGGWAVFILMMLACGSFDGVNETFWWLGVLGINPLEFPGRSAVVGQNVAGLLAANALLLLIFAVTVKIGLMLNRSNMALGEAVRLFAPTVLPIALGYHIAHYYTAFLVEGQYLWAAIEGAMEAGHDHAGHEHQITTGFFNTTDSVRRIWLTQAGAVVLGHVIAVMLAHGVALRVFGTARRALLSQTPLALFMIGYTFFGLWLLASPRGV